MAGVFLQLKHPSNTCFFIWMYILINYVYMYVYIIYIYNMYLHTKTHVFTVHIHRYSICHYLHIFLLVHYHLNNLSYCISAYQACLHIFPVQVTKHESQDPIFTRAP